MRFVQIAPDRVVNLAHVFDAEWVTDENDVRELQLFITGAPMKFDGDQGFGPAILFLQGEAADRAWAALLGQAEPLPAPTAPVAPAAPEDDELSFDYSKIYGVEMPAHTAY